MPSLKMPLMQLTAHLRILTPRRIPYFLQEAPINPSALSAQFAVKLCRARVAELETAVAEAKAAGAEAAAAAAEKETGGLEDSLDGETSLHWPNLTSPQSCISRNLNNLKPTHLTLTLSR